jgi:hypothetical protein
MQITHTKGIITVAVCALCMSLGMGAGKQVRKPYKITGEVVGQITSVTLAPDGKTPIAITFEAVNVGEATHCGRYWNEITAGQLSLVTFQGTSQGVFYPADDKKSTVTWTGTIAGTTLTVTATGGTGRFAGGSGGFVAQMDNIELDFDNMTLSYTYKGSGEVIY